MKYKRSQDGLRKKFTAVDLIRGFIITPIVCTMIVIAVSVVAILMRILLFNRSEVEDPIQESSIQEDIVKLSEIICMGERVLYYEQETMRIQLDIRNMATDIYILYREKLRASDDNEHASEEIERYSMLCSNVSVDDINVLIDIMLMNRSELDLSDIESIANQLSILESQFYEYRQKFNESYTEYRELLSEYSDVVSEYNYTPVIAGN